MTGYLIGTVQKNKSLLIDNLPHNHNLCKKKYIKVVLLPLVLILAGNGCEFVYTVGKCR